MLATTECTKKHDNLRIKRIVLDLHDVIVDSRVVLFEYEKLLLS